MQRRIYRRTDGRINKKAMNKDAIIEILKKHQHSMAGHNWLIGLDESDFILIADAILALFEQKKSKSVWMTAKEFLFSKYPLVSPDWFNDNELTQEMIKMMEQYLEYAQQPQKVEQEEETGMFMITENGPENIEEEEKPTDDRIHL